jgi:hypothetical protein
MFEMGELLLRLGANGALPLGQEGAAKFHEYL